MIDLGKVRPGSTIRIPFGSYAASTGASSATTNYAAADIQVYKNGSTTQRASASGITATADFDTNTGINLITIDLSDNTTADFWNAGAEYIVVVADVTIDGQTVRFPAARFTIGIDGAQLETTIATLSSQTSFTLTTGPAEDNALSGCLAYIHDIASAVQCGYAYVSSYTGSTKTVTLAAGTTFTVAAGDNISFLPRTDVYSLAGTACTARDIGASVLLSAGTGTGQLDFTSGVVKANVTQFGGTNATSSGGRPEVNTSHIAGSAVSTSTAQIGVNVIQAAGTAWGSGAITAASIAADAITDAKVAADVTIASVTGAVGSVTGNVGGNVSGSVGSIATGGISAASFAAGAIDAAAIAADAIGSSELAASAVTEIQAGLSTLDAAGIRTAVGLASANLDTQLSGIQSDTNDIQTRLPAALTAGGNMKSDALAVNGSTTAASNLSSSAQVLYVGTVDGATTTTTLIDSSLTQSATDFWKGRIIIFLSGALKYQATDITAFDPATDKLTFTALTAAPSAADTYVVL